MKARVLGNFLIVYPRYGGRQIVPAKWWWQRVKFLAWYLRYFLIWNDEITHIDGEPIGEWRKP